MSRKVTVMNDVNNFASVNFGHCAKSKHFALDLRISLGSKTKCLDFPQCPQVTDTQLLTSNWFYPFSQLMVIFLYNCSNDDE